MRHLCTLLVLALLLTPTVFARHNVNDLPVRNIYDPKTRENEPITEYTFWELDALLDNPKFRQWNDLDRVCDAMVALYGQAGHACGETASVWRENPNMPPQWLYPVQPPTYRSYERRYVYSGPPPWAYPPMPPPRPYWRSPYERRPC